MDSLFKKILIFCIISGPLVLTNLSAQSVIESSGNESFPDSSLHSFVNTFVNGPFFNELTGYHNKDSVSVECYRENDLDKSVGIFFDKPLGYAPWRSSYLEVLYDSLRAMLPDKYSNYVISFYADNVPVIDLIPNYFRKNVNLYDKSRESKKEGKKCFTLVKNLSAPVQLPYVLQGRNIALWPSHGWYYEHELQRWEWQRARLFRTVEDLFPYYYTMNFLVPMLENSGLGVFIPRERSWQKSEVIVDNDTCLNNSVFRLNEENISSLQTERGFAKRNETISGNENPFNSGTSLSLVVKANKEDIAEWIPDIPEDGYYPVYISYSKDNKNSSEVMYSLYHTGGGTDFLVNQKACGGTWVYLGTFHFRKGLHPETGRLKLSSGKNQKHATISIDAARFGGGMGNIEREGGVSGRPRYQEAARYYLQYAGYPDSLVWNLKMKEKDDYKDDLNCHGEWVNYLASLPLDKGKVTEYQGMNVPIDLALALHSDAGVREGDSIVGTLGIYATGKKVKIFSNGRSRMTSRDMTDIIQTEIIEDIRRVYNEDWTRRAMWDRGYSEALRPGVPTMLLELFSHQNLNDVIYAQDPGFLFTVSRAVYKGILKYLSFEFNLDYVVQPLPVEHFATTIKENGSVYLSWEPVMDSLEPTAKPEGYIVYQRINDAGFDNGTLVEQKYLEISGLSMDSIYSFKVCAYNRGGKSFPSEVLSLCRNSASDNQVLIVNAFDRTGGAAWFKDSLYSGFLDMKDQGVPYMQDTYTTGYQYDFDRNSEWLDDDSPGHGASYADHETSIIPGNTFDYSYIHGISVRNAGYSFVSVSDEAAFDDGFDLTTYGVVDLLAGEERISFLPGDSSGRFPLFPERNLLKIDNYLKAGGSILISGAYTGADVHLSEQDSLAGEILKYKWRTSNASRTGEFWFTNSFDPLAKQLFRFNTGFRTDIYTVESADAIEPSNDNNAKTLIRYTENNMSGGVLVDEEQKMIILGFPFETIIGEESRDLIMKEFLNRLSEK